MKKLFLLLISLSFLFFSCATYSCLDEAFNEATKIQNKDNLIFVEGIVWPDIEHVQLWLYEDSKFKVLSGHLFEDKWKFQATDFYAHGTYLIRVRDYY